MKSTFRICFKRDRFCDYESRTIEAESVSDILKELKYSTIRSITVQCAGTTKNNEPCQRFTHNAFCCEAHETKA